MIESFKHKGLANYYEKGDIGGIQPKHAERIGYILDIIDAAADIKDINFPGSNLHKLQPKNKGIWAVKVSGNWRITFKFKNGNAYIVDYLDYH